MAQWLYRIVPTRAEMVEAARPEEQQLMAAHFQYLLEMKERGTLVVAGRTQEAAESFGIVIFEAADEGAARAIMNADPGVAGGVVAATLHPFVVAVAQD